MIKGEKTIMNINELKELSKLNASDMDNIDFEAMFESMTDEEFNALYDTVKKDENIKGRIKKEFIGESLRRVVNIDSVLPLEEALNTEKFKNMINEGF